MTTRGSEASELAQGQGRQSGNPEVPTDGSVCPSATPASPEDQHLLRAAHLAGLGMLGRDRADSAQPRPAPPRAQAPPRHPGPAPSGPQRKRKWWRARTEAGSGGAGRRPRRFAGFAVMAEKFDHLEEHLEKFVENIRQLGIIVSDFQPSSQAGLNQKL